MERLTTDNPKNNLQTALNLFYAKDGEAWVRGGGPRPEYQDVTLNDYIRRAIKQVATCPPMFDELDDQKLAEVMSDWCMDEIESHEGIIGMLYTAGWVCAELRARLKAYEDTGLMPEEAKAKLGWADRTRTALRNVFGDVGVFDITALRQKWIPVAERLPEDGVQVLACTKHGKPFPSHCRGGAWRVSHSVTITHWMPMPAAPEEVRNAK